MTAGRKKWKWITALLMAILVPTFLVWMWELSHRPTIRLVGYKIEEMPRKGLLGENLAPYQIKHAIFRITNRSDSPYSFPTVDNEPFYGAKLWKVSGDAETSPPSRDCGMVPISIREVPPKGSVDFSVAVTGMATEYKAFAVALPMYRGNAAEYETFRSKHTFLTDLKDHFRMLCSPRSIPGAVWSDKLELGGS